MSFHRGGFSVAGYDAAVEGAKLAQADLEKLASELTESGALKNVDHEIVVTIGDFLGGAQAYCHKLRG